MTKAIIAKSRQERGIELQHERGQEFFWAAPFIGVVPGSKGEEYTVNLQRQTCECEDFERRAEQDRHLDLETEACKHLVAWGIEWELRRAMVRQRRAKVSA